MADLHPDAELAPRDVVARANFRQQKEGRGAFLDATHLGDEFPHRFPTVFGYARAAGIDPRVEAMPVSPAEHYYMGGIHTDDEGRTSLPGMWAVGECSSSGLHGANRLASNSLLEGLVMGGRVAESIERSPGTDSTNIEGPRGAWAARPEPSDRAAAVRSIMWTHVGVERTGSGLTAAAEQIASMPSDDTIDGRNAPLLASLIVQAALAREESRGGHHRLDFPDTDPDQAQRTLLPGSAAPMERLPAAVA